MAFADPAVEQQVSAKDNLDFRAEALKHKPSLSQTVAKRFATQKLMRASIMLRCPSAFELLPEVHCVIFEVPALTNPEASAGLTASVAAVRNSGIPLILWTQDGGDSNASAQQAIKGLALVPTAVGAPGIVALVALRRRHW